MTSLNKKSSHISLSPIMACLGCKIAYTSMRNCVDPLGIRGDFSYRLGMGGYCCRYNYEVLVGKACGLWSPIHIGTCNRGQGQRCFSERRPSANHSGRLHHLASLGVFREMVALDRDRDRWRLFGHRRLP